MIDKQRMCDLAGAYDIHLQEGQLAQLDVYAQMLCDWNQKINLTAITQPEDIEVKHFLDSLLFASLPQVEGSLVDVGTGAGFPGVVSKIAKPSLEVTLLEPTGKRVRFLQEVTAALNIKAETLKERAEEAARKQWREVFDVATARAVAALPLLCEYCLPLVKPGGWFIAMKGDAAQEVEDARRAISLLGGKLEEVREYSLSDGARRSLVFIKKAKETPKQYPRNGGVIAKRPL